MRYFLGLDNGGTATKAALFDEKGRELAVAGMETETQISRSGYIERDMEKMWKANCSVIRSVIQKAGIEPEKIACVAVCGHGKGLYLWGKDQKPAYRGILSTDNRAWRYPEQWKQDGTESEVFKRTCQHILSSQPVSLLAWLRDHEPDVLNRTQWIFACKDYIRFRLTGEACAERTDYSGCNLLNLYTGDYDEKLMELFGLKEYMDRLPPLKASADVCGYVTREAAEAAGLKEGTPVAGGAFDIDACALAAGITDETRICMIAGTWSINEYIAKRPVTDGSVLMNSFFCLPEYYLIEECSPTSAGNSSWFMKNLLPELQEKDKETGDSIYQQMNAWVDDIPMEEFCPIYLPFLMGSNAHPNARGCFVGINSYHTRKHLLRSVYEGVAFSHRYHLEKLLKTRDKLPVAIRLAGGAAHSPVWTQMFADVMKFPVEIVQADETGALGCAMIGAAASGAYSDIASACTEMCHVTGILQPDKTRAAVYDKKYELYCKTISALDGLWDAVQVYHGIFGKE